MLFFFCLCLFICLSVHVCLSTNRVPLTIKSSMLHSRRNTRYGSWGSMGDRADEEVSKSKSLYRVKTSDYHESLAVQDADPWAIWIGFKESTSAHGIPHINKAPGEEILFCCFVAGYRPCLASKRLCDPDPD